MNRDKMIFWLHELCQEHSALVGKKCANIGELTKAGFRVPQGFALALSAYEEFLETTGVIDKIHKHFAQFDADPDNPEDLPRYVEAGKVVRAIFESETMPRHIADNVLEHYDELCRETGIRDVAVSTRSAGPASHPGQYETYLGVAGRSHVIDHIIKVWSSTYNTRSLVARARKGLPLEYDPIGVGVCKMVNARAAGVMFTADPNTADASRILIEGTWGLGEGVVSGSVIPDGWVVNKPRFEIIERRLSSQYNDPGLDSRESKTAPPMNTSDDQKGCLRDDEVCELAKTGERIEKYFGMPQDIEWALDIDSDPDESIVILQARPEKFKIDFISF